MNSSNTPRTEERAQISLNRRTALAGLAGLGGFAGGSILGYRTFLADDEPAFAETDLDLTADSLTIDTVEGNVVRVELAENTKIDIGYENFRPGDIDDGDEEFTVTIDIEVYEDQGDDGDPDTSDTPDVEGELVSFNLDLDPDNLPHHTIETELTADDTTQDEAVPLDEVEGIEDDYEIFGIEDPELGDEKTTSLEFTYTVDSNTYDGEHPDNSRDWPELTDSDSIETTVHVTAVDDGELEIAVGGNVIMEGEAEHTPA